MTVRRVLDGDGNWRTVGSIMPLEPQADDLRGETTPFHGRYRGPHNTGVPDRSQLKTPRFGGILNTPDITYNDEHFIGFIELRATGVTFNRCFFEGRNDLFTFNAMEETTLYDCDLYGSKSNYVADVTIGSIHAVRCHIWGGGQDSIGFGENATYEDCYIHGNVPHFGTHSDSAQTLGGSDNLAMRRCKFLAYDPVTNSSWGYNAAWQIGVVVPGTMNGLDLIDNYVDGGGFTVNGNLNLSGITNVEFRGNRWGRHSAFGPITGESKVTAPHGVYDEATNVFDDTGESV